MRSSASKARHMSRVHARVPATTANLGPGFDSLGLALELYIDVFLETGAARELLRMEGETRGIGGQSGDNLVIRACDTLFEAAGQRPTGLSITISNQIPVGKGLGSSAAAIVAGMFAANRLLGDPLPAGRLLDMAVEMEGHPDNVVPAMAGGLTASMMSAGRVYYHRLDPGRDLKVVVAVPDFDFPTKTARAVLPDQVSREDFIDGIQKTSFLLAGLIQHDYNHLRLALERLRFQEVRSAFIPGYGKIVEGACAAGALGVTLSGAGPSLAAFTLGNEAAICAAMTGAFAGEGIAARCYILSPAREGICFPAT